MKSSKTLSYLFILIIMQQSQAEFVISNDLSGQLGDRIMSYCNAKILAQRLGIKFIYQIGLRHYLDLFELDNTEPYRLTTIELQKQYPNKIRIRTTEQLQAILSRPVDTITPQEKDIHLEIYLTYNLNHITPAENETLKSAIQLKKQFISNFIPKNMLSIAVHIRKGNGGGERYDGELSSQQIFDFDRSVVDYIYKYDREPFQFDCGLLNMKLLNKRFMDTSVNYFKFPTEQYYIDQIVKISDDIDHKPIFVLLLTDDISPLELLKRFEKALNKPNIILYYHDNRNKSHAERIAEDLFAMSQCTGLIRSESNFSKIAEIMGDHKFVFFPLEFRWEEKKLIVRKVVAKNYLEFLKIN